MSTKKEKDTDINVNVEITKDKIIITDNKYNQLLNIDAKYVRSVLGIVAVLIDDEIKNTLDKEYVNKNKDWKYNVNCTLSPKDMLNGEW
jgi:hypothetical protein